MPKLFIVLVFIVVGQFNVKAFNHNDSVKKHQFYVSLSAKPILNWVSKIDSSSNFLNSKSLLEFQYQYKKHLVGVGLNFNRSNYKTQINNLPLEEIKSGISFNPYYCFQAYNSKRIKIYTGIGYIKNNQRNKQVITSNIEKITYTSEYREEGANILIKLNYQLNTKWSIETDLSLYNLKSTTQYDEIYPLTPSLNFYKYSTFQKSYISTLANIFLKYSF